MIIANFITKRPTMGETRTYEDFYKFLGMKPHRLGIVSRLYPQYTASYLTEALKNIFYVGNEKGNKYRSIDTMYFEWEIETNQIHRPELAARPEGDGKDGTSIFFSFKENYYQKYDIFRHEGTFEQFQVISRPIRKADDYWTLECRLITSNIEDSIDVELFNAGDTTRFLSNAHPEEHEEGYVKYQSNTERHRGYIMTHRVDDSYSALYKAHENVFISIGKGDGNGNKKEAIYKMNKVEANLLENFLYVRNNALLFAKSNIDKDGKPTISDPDTGRPIYISDGVIPQVERFASKYVYNKLTVDAFLTALSMMNQKAEKETGNSYVMICNEKLWQDILKVLGSYLANFKTDGAYLYSKQANGGNGGYVSVGTNFNGYNFAGNSLAFKVDRTFSREYGNDKGFGLILDLTSDKTSSEPAIQMFTLKGGDFITNKLPGVGGLDGLSSGLVASTVASSKLINWGYSGIAVFNPYRSFILRQA